MFEVIKLLQETSVVQIFGIPGVGKSTLARNIACYIAERNIFKEGVLFINMCNVQSVKDLYNKVSEVMENKLAKT